MHTFTKVMIQVSIFALVQMKWHQFVIYLLVNDTRIIKQSEDGNWKINCILKVEFHIIKLHFWLPCILFEKHISAFQLHFFPYKVLVKSLCFWLLYIRRYRIMMLCSSDYVQHTLKLYCRYLYTKPCMINHIWSLKQLWLQVNGHAWFHLQRLRWPVRNGEGAKNSKWKYMSPAGFEPTPRQSTTGKLQRLRPLGHAG